MKMTEEELYDRCPYNKSHIILKSRMMYHMVKCKKTHRPIQYGISMSPNQTMDGENSFLTCMQDGNMDRKNLTVKEKKLLSVPLPEPAENWDDTDVGFSYDPNLKVQSEPLLRCLAVAPKSERKDFRYNERKRFFTFDERDPLDTSGRRRQGTRPVCQQQEAKPECEHQETKLECQHQETKATQLSKSGQSVPGNNFD